MNLSKLKSWLPVTASNNLREAEKPSSTINSGVDDVNLVQAHLKNSALAKKPILTRQFKELFLELDHELTKRIKAGSLSFDTLVENENYSVSLLEHLFEQQRNESFNELLKQFKPHSLEQSALKTPTIDGSTYIKDDESQLSFNPLEKVTIKALDPLTSYREDTFNSQKSPRFAKLIQNHIEPLKDINSKQNFLDYAVENSARSFAKVIITKAAKSDLISTDQLVKIFKRSADQSFNQEILKTYLAKNAGEEQKTDNKVNFLVAKFIKSLHNSKANQLINKAVAESNMNLLRTLTESKVLPLRSLGLIYPDKARKIEAALMYLQQTFKDHPEKLPIDTLKKDLTFLVQGMNCPLKAVNQANLSVRGLVWEARSVARRDYAKSTLNNHLNELVKHINTLIR
jgi:hypothetical protein